MRYIKCFALKIDNNYIPYWLLDYVEDEDCGKGYKYGNGYNDIYYGELTECLYDLVEKKVILGIVKNYYEPARFSINQQVLVEVDYGKYTLKTIKDIIYEEYNSQCTKAKDLEEYHLRMYFTEEERNSIKLDDLYEFRSWKPFYVLKDGSVIKYDYKLNTLI